MARAACWPAQSEGASPEGVVRFALYLLETPQQSAPQRGRAVALKALPDDTRSPSSSWCTAASIRLQARPPVLSPMRRSKLDDFDVRLEGRRESSEGTAV